MNRAFFWDLLCSLGDAIHSGSACIMLVILRVTKAVENATAMRPVWDNFRYIKILIQKSEIWPHLQLGNGSVRRFRYGTVMNGKINRTGRHPLLQMVAKKPLHGTSPSHPNWRASKKRALLPSPLPRLPLAKLSTRPAWRVQRQHRRTSATALFTGPGMRDWKGADIEADIWSTRVLCSFWSFSHFGLVPQLCRL